MNLRKFARAIPLGMAVAALFAFSIGAQAKHAPKQDKYPNGCVSCHVKDKSLNTVMGKVKGHPNVAGMTKTVPTSCGMCHKKGPKPPKLQDAIHKAHDKKLSLGGDFGKKPAGACLNCHSADGKIKSGAKNW